MAAAGLILASGAAIAASVGSGVYVGGLSTEAKNLRARVETLRAETAAAAASARPLAPGVTGRKLAALPMVLALDQLSAAVPPDTWLTDLRMEDGWLFVAGMSAEAASLVGVLEATSLLADVRLSAPTANDLLSGRERFSIEARIEEAAR